MGRFSRKCQWWGLRQAPAAGGREPWLGAGWSWDLRGLCCWLSFRFQASQEKASTRFLHEASHRWW